MSEAPHPNEGTLGTDTEAPSPVSLKLYQKLTEKTNG